MSKKLKFLAMMLTCILLNVNYACGATWNHTFSSNPISEGSMTINSATWSVATESPKGSPTISYATYSKIGGVKFGSSGQNYWGKITLSTSYFTSGNISSVTVNALLNAGVSTTMTIKQGSTTIGSPTYSTATTWHNFIANTNTGSGGTLSIEITSSNAIYIHSISVTYTAAGSTKTLHFPSHKSGHSFLPNLSFSLCQCSSCNFFKCLTVALYFHCILYFLYYLLFIMYAYTHKKRQPRL